METIKQEVKMETNIDPTTSLASTISEAVCQKTASAPLFPFPLKPEDTQLTTQISAPFYLFSLKANDAPPFIKPDTEARPRLLIGTIMTAEDAIQMISASDADEADGLKKYLGDFLVEKKIVLNYNLSEKSFLIGLLTETVDYAAQRDFSAFELACLITIYLDTHLFFKYYYWLSPAAVWSYFKEVMIRHTIEDSPDGQEVFGPEECYDILTHFHTMYLSNLPLVHILSFGAYRFKLMWPFKPK